MLVKQPNKARVIVSGILFFYPLAGVTYQFLHYLIGLRRLGYDPYYVEDSGRWVYDPSINDITGDARRNVASVAAILEHHGFAGRWAFRGNYPEGECYGMTESEILRLYQDAELFLNVTGAQEIREEHLACPRRVYVESDPFASQVRAADGDEQTLATLRAHDTHFSFGENLGADDCEVPLAGFRWLPTRQPVLMDLWDGAGCLDTQAYRTITTWHNKGKNLRYRGDTYYWTKDREFEKFLSLPERCSVPFELAVGVSDDVRRRLLNHGWRQVDSVEISADVARYRSYIQRSRAEFTVARDQYARPRTGWFSDRSACYLAAGRPVVTQETGFSKYLPTGKGLFAFRTMDDVAAAVEAIESDYEGNCRAAREVAREYFAAEKVLGSMLARAGVA